MHKRQYEGESRGFFSGMQSFFIFVAFRLFSYLLMNSVAPMI